MDCRSELMTLFENGLGVRLPSLLVSLDSRRGNKIVPGVSGSNCRGKSYREPNFKQSDEHDDGGCEVNRSESGDGQWLTDLRVRTDWTNSETVDRMH
jgi:hypothetical protein